MNALLTTPPTIEPVSLAQVKMHLRLDSETLAGNLTTYQSISPGSHGIHELMTLDVAPGGAGWVAGDTITGASSHETCIIVTVLTTKTYYVRNRSGSFTLGEVLSNGTATADQGAANPAFTTGYYLIGTGVYVFGKEAIVNLNAGEVGAGGTVDAKIQESNDNSTYTDVESFTQVTADNDNSIIELAYTGTKQYIRVVVKGLGAACEFGADVIVNSATTAEDSLLTNLITAARREAEDMTGRALLTQTWDYYLDEYPAEDFITLPFGNLQSVTYVKYKNSEGTETTMTPTTDYIVETNGEGCGAIVLPYGVSWPSFTPYPSKPITIRFVCGWATSVPENIISAILFEAERQYYHGDRDAILLPLIKNLLRNYRIWREF